MKLLISLVCLILSVNTFAQENSTYFFLDAGCKGCLDKDGNSPENYWIITDQAFHIPKKLTIKEEETILTEFKHSIIQKYSLPLSSINSVCIRYDGSEEAIHKNRASKVEKMQNNGYYVAELELNLPELISHPSIEAYLNNLEGFGFSGAILVAEKGEIIHKGFYGWSNADNKINTSEHTLFPSASIAKAFTAQEILYLNQSNSLDLNSSISNYFEELPEDKKEITIHQLLSHTAGIRRTILNANDTSQSKALNKLLNKSLRNEPGKVFKYSNAGYQLLALLIEKVTATSYQTAIKNQILIPSGMSNAGFLNSNFQWFDLAHGYSEFGSTKFPLTATYNYSKIGSRGIVGTIEDYYNWINTLASQKDYFSKLDSISVNTRIEG